MSYSGIGLNHQLEVDGQIFVSNIESGSTIPFEIYSDYSNKGNLKESRQLRLRVTPSELPNSTSHIDMGIDNQNGDYFYINQPVFDSTITGNRNLFNIDKTGQTNITAPIVSFGTLTTSNIIAQSMNNVLDKIDNSYEFGLKTESLIEIEYDNTVQKEILNISKVCVSKGSIMVLSTEGKLYAAGKNDYGQLGLGDRLSRYRLTPVLGEGASGVVDVKSDSFYFTILKNNGSLYSCGLNDYGQFGVADRESTTQFVQMTGEGASGVVYFDTSRYEIMFVKDTGAAYTTRSNSWIPEIIPGEGSSGVTQCAICSTHAALLKNDALYLRGENAKLGIGLLSGYTSSFTLFDNEFKSGVVKVNIKEGIRGLTVLKDDGAIYVTSSFSTTYTALDNDNYLNYSTLIMKSGDKGASGVIDIDSSFEMTIIKKNDGKIYTKGRTDYGQLGIGFVGRRYYNSVHSYTEVPNFENVQHISVDADGETCAIVFNNKVYIAGRLNIENIKPFKSTFTQLGDVFMYDNVLNINNTITGNSVIKHALSDDNENNGAVYGLYETPTSTLMRFGVFTSNPTNYVTIDEQATVNATSYGPFTGSHVGVTNKSIEKNLIVSVDNTMPLAIFSTNDVITGVSITDIENDPNVFGVSDGDEHYNALGDGTVWVSDANGTLNAGDYITSSTLSGYGVRQEGSRKMNYTVAKILQNCDFTNAKRFLSMSEDKTLSTITKEEYLSNTGNVYRAEVVACTYHCG